MGRSRLATALRQARAAIGRRRVFAAALVAALAAAFGFWTLLPATLFSAPESYVLVARDGTLLSARIATDGQWRFPPQHAVPHKFRRALLVFEDKRFEQHTGVDGLAIARAMRLNLRAGRVVSGGSTLTMQLARLSRGAQQRNVSNKLAEALLALRIEASFAKGEILALYAGHAPFGGNVVGLEAAAWRYFGRNPETLSWAEAATLAVLPNNPALVHLARNRPRLQAKRDFLLRRLHEAGDLTALDLDVALSEPLAAEPHDLPDLAPHLLDTLRAQDPSRHRIVTTLDARLQRDATQFTREHSAALARQNVHNAAALIVDNTTFEVLAYVGNSSEVLDPSRGHAVDVIRRPRSTGSILKPLLYAAMLEDGSLTPRLLLPDVPTRYEGFQPENFDRQYRGAVPADEALAHSLNVPAVRMLRTYGVARFADLLRSAGMTTLTRPGDDYGLTLVLGGAEGNLWDVSSMYASLAGLARAGVADPEPRFRELTALRGTPARTRGAVAIGTGAAWLTLDTLLAVPRPGEEGHWRNFASSRSIAWKTGTSWGLRDGWAVGSTSRHTIGVWVGNASGEGRPGLTGSTMAAPLMFALFNSLPASPWFAMPAHALRRMDTCENDGFLATAACVATETWVPADSHFDLLSPHNLRVNLALDGKQRVDSDCESPGRMVQADWFVLPPAEEFYYRRVHAGYRPLPTLRADCAATRAGGRPALALLYPDPNATVLIPQELDGQRGRTIFEAVHRRREAILYWHLDDRYLGETHTFHQQSLDIDPGEHILTVVDDEGERVARRFQVIATRKGL
ncbi:MAG TPA: penicillin-binding protein 1C [Steroidobacteraceae bacterium]|nr:penicillin-binding protein 1C [Steroidobacteraceae bacterium]